MIASGTFARVQVCSASPFQNKFPSGKDMKLQEPFPPVPPASWSPNVKTGVR